MHFDPQNFYHIYNRSFNKTLLFYKPSNYYYFIKKLNGLREYCDILAFCLMPDHFHLMIYINDQSEGCTRLTAPSGLTGMQALTRKIGTVQNSYTQAINKQETRTGSIFQPKSKAKQLDQVFICFNYIHQNPLKAGLVSKIEDWEYSSFNEYYKGVDGICNIILANEMLDLPEDQELFYKQSYEVISDSIRMKILE